MNKGTLIVNGIDYSNGGGTQIPQELIDQVEQNTSDIVDLNSNKADKLDVINSKNLLNCDNFKAERTIAGVKLTPVFNSSGLLQYINANGKATAEAVLALTYNALYKNGTRYILSGCIGGSASTYALYWEGHAGQFDAEVAVTETATSKQVVKIVIKNGVTVDNVKFYPMIRLATEPTGYEPYNVGHSFESNMVSKSGDTMTGNLSVPSISDNEYNKIVLNNDNVEIHSYADGSGLELYGYPNSGGDKGLVLRVLPSEDNVGAVVTNGVGKINISAPNGLLLNGYELKKSVPADAKFTDTTYGQATDSKLGLVKLYDSALDAKNTDGAPTQEAVHDMYVSLNEVSFDISVRVNKLGTHYNVSSSSSYQATAGQTILSMYLPLGKYIATAYAGGARILITGGGTYRFGVNPTAYVEGSDTISVSVSDPTMIYADGANFYLDIMQIGV